MFRTLSAISLIAITSSALSFAVASSNRFRVAWCAVRPTAWCQAAQGVGAPQPRAPGSEAIEPQDAPPTSAPEPEIPESDAAVEPPLDCPTADSFSEDDHGDGQTVPCEDCVIEETNYFRSLDTSKARVGLPVAFLETAESVWIRTSHGESHRIWPVDYNLGEVSFHEEFQPLNPATPPITAGPLGYMVVEEAIRFPNEADIYLVARLHDEETASRVSDVQPVFSPGSFGGFPGSGGCSACNLQLATSLMTLRVPEQFLSQRLTLVGGEQEVRVWPPRVGTGLRSLRRGADGTILLQVPSIGASEYALGSDGSFGKVFYNDHNGQGGALFENPQAGF